MNYGHVYADFLEHCPTVQPPRPWCRFAKAEKVWRTPSDIRSMMAELITAHSRHALIRSGVAVGVGKFDMTLHPIFHENLNGAVLPLRRSPAQPPFALMTEQGSTSQRLPLCDAVRDFQVSHAIESCGMLFVTHGLQDAIRLRLIGLPAAPAHGLEQFTERSLREFRYAFGLLEQQPPVVPHRLIITGWSLTKLSWLSNAALEPVLQNLTDCAPCLGLGLQNILVWQPTPTELDGLARCLEIGRLEDVAAVILGSIEQSCMPLAPDPAEPNPKTDLLECDRRLRHALIRPETNSARRRRRLLDYQDVLEEKMIKPLLVRAENEKDLKESYRLKALAELFRSLYPATAVQRAKFEKQVVEQGLSGEASLLDLNNLLRGFGTAYKMLEEDD